MPDAAPTCTRCSSDNLGSHLSLCTSSDSMSDSYTRWVRCSACDARYIVLVKEDVAVGFDSDGHMVNRGFTCDVAEWDRTLAVAQRCPSRERADCTCAAHVTSPKTLAEVWYRSW